MHHTHKTDINTLIDSRTRLWKKTHEMYSNTLRADIQRKSEILIV